MLITASSTIILPSLMNPFFAMAAHEICKALYAEGLLREPNPHSPRAVQLPLNLFVAGFIGAPQMNFFNDAKLVLKGDKYYAQIKRRDFELSVLHQKALKTRNKKPCDIVAGIRPDHVVWARAV